MSRIDEILEDLRSRKRAVSCNGKAGLLAYMDEMGFISKSGKSPNHKVFVHKQLTETSNNEFKSHSIDCGHAPKKPMKFSYVVNTIRLMEKYQLELVEIMEARL